MHADIVAKLIGIGKEAVTDINSCDADKILRAFENIRNYIGSNGNEVGHQVQQAFTSGTHYDWAAMVPPEPRELMIKTEPKGGREPTLTKVAPKDASQFSIISFEAQAKNHTLKGIKYVDACVKVYSWIWTVCTQATRDKLKTVPGFADFERRKDCIELSIAISGVSL